MPSIFERPVKPLAAIMLAFFMFSWLPHEVFAQQQGGGAFQNQKAKKPARKKATSKKQSAQQQLPATINISERGRWGTFRIKLRKVGRRTYSGRWSHGVESRISVLTYGNARIKFRRIDKKGHLGSVTGTYSGRITAPNRAAGTSALSNGTNAKWNANW